MKKFWTLENCCKSAAVLIIFFIAICYFDWHTHDLLSFLRGVGLAFGIAAGIEMIVGVGRIILRRVASR
jgi:hypothetical protein